MPHQPGHTAQPAQGWDSFAAGPVAVPSTKQAVLSKVRSSGKSGSAGLTEAGARTSSATDGAPGPGTGLELELDFLEDDQDGGAVETSGDILVVGESLWAPLAPPSTKPAPSEGGAFSPLILGGLVLGGFYLFTR